MTRSRIIPIVEGHGEETAVPLLLDRWLRFRRFERFFEVPERAVNAKGSGNLKAAYNRRRHLGIEHYVEAAVRGGADAILVILDADDECVAANPAGGLGPRLLSRARSVTPHLPLGVVVANREYEAWFLASLTALRSRGHFESGVRLASPLQAETPRDCKGLVEKLLGVPYEERVHQTQLTGSISFTAPMARRAPSFGKLMRDLERITRETRMRSAA